VVTRVLSEPLGLWVHVDIVGCKAIVVLQASRVCKVQREWLVNLVLPALLVLRARLVLLVPPVHQDDVDHVVSVVLLVSWASLACLDHRARSGMPACRVSRVHLELPELLGHLATRDRLAVLGQWERRASPDRLVSTGQTARMASPVQTEPMVHEARLVRVASLVALAARAPLVSLALLASLAETGHVELLASLVCVASPVQRAREVRMGLLDHVEGLARRQSLRKRLLSKAW